MKITTKGQYGLSFMIELAKLGTDKPIPLKVIANPLEISEAYLEQIVLQLKNAKLVKSTRGAHGGYVLSKHPGEITAYEMFVALEGDIQVVANNQELDAGKRALYDEIQNAILDVLHKTTLEQIKDKSLSSEHNYMFYI